MKKKRFIKLFSILTVFILMFSLVCISASAESYSSLTEIFSPGTVLCEGSPIGLNISNNSWLNESLKQPCFYVNHPLGDITYQEFKILLPFNDSFINGLSDSEYDLNVSFSARSFGSNNKNPLSSTTYNYDSIHFNNDMKAYLYKMNDLNSFDATLHHIDVSNVVSVKFDTSSCVDNFTLSVDGINLKEYDGICLIQNYEGNYQSYSRLFLGFSPNVTVPFTLNVSGSSGSLFQNLTLLSNYSFNNLSKVGNFVVSNPYLLCIIGLVFVGFAVGLYFRFRK